MKPKHIWRIVALLLSLLVISLPICFADTLSLTYDANGNLVSGDGKYRVYNSLNQLWKVYNGSDANGKLLEEFTYHPTEERVLVKKVYNPTGQLEETVYYINKEFVRVVNSSGSYDYVYVYHEGQLVAQRKPDGTKEFVHGDHLGSSTVITDENGDTIENTTYEPFGSIVEGGNTTRYDYTGQEYDSMLGDYDYHARRYKSEWGVFLSPDPVIQNRYAPQFLNHYTYTGNNPYLYIDLTGEDAIIAANYHWWKHSNLANIGKTITGNNAWGGHEVIIVGDRTSGYTLYSFSQGNLNPDPINSKTIEGALQTLVAQSGDKSPFEVYAEFETTTDQDKVLHKSAMENALSGKYYNCQEYSIATLNSIGVGHELSFLEENIFFLHKKRLEESETKWKSKRLKDFMSVNPLWYPYILEKTYGLGGGGRGDYDYDPVQECYCVGTGCSWNQGNGDDDSSV